MATVGDVLMLTAWFIKEAEKVGKSQRRYFVLIKNHKDNTGVVKYYEAEDMRILKGAIPLHEINSTICDGTKLNIITPKRVYRLQAETPTTAFEWNDILSHRSIVMPTVLSPQSIEWTANKESSQCMQCAKSFTVILRRHHCRFCGELLCASCAPLRKSIVMKRKGGMRTCNECFTELVSEEPTFLQTGNTARRRATLDKLKSNADKQHNSLGELAKNFKDIKALSKPELVQFLMLCNVKHNANAPIDDLRRVATVLQMQLTEATTNPPQHISDDADEAPTPIHEGNESQDNDSNTYSNTNANTNTNTNTNTNANTNTNTNTNTNVVVVGGPPTLPVRAYSPTTVASQMLSSNNPFAENVVSSDNMIYVDVDNLFLPSGSGDIPQAPVASVDYAMVTFENGKAVINNSNSNSSCHIYDSPMPVDDESQSAMMNRDSYSEAKFVHDVSGKEARQSYTNVTISDTNNVQLPQTQRSPRSPPSQSPRGHEQQPPRPSRTPNMATVSQSAYTSSQVATCQYTGPRGACAGFVAHVSVLFCSNHLCPVYGCGRAKSSTVATCGNHPPASRPTSIQSSKVPTTAWTPRRHTTQPKQGKQVGRKAAALVWCQELSSGSGVEIKNFSTSFGSGLAFCAIMWGLFPEMVDMTALKPENRTQNFELAFKVAEKMGQERYLEVEDCVEVPYPDSLSVMTYIFELHRKFAKLGRNQRS